ncbi:MAG: hypothetical protein AAFQ05_01745 [Pseudomonadota bacterium]
MDALTARKFSNDGFTAQVRHMQDAPAGTATTPKITQSKAGNEGMSRFGRLAEQ